MWNVVYQGAALHHTDPRASLSPEPQLIFLLSHSQGKIFTSFRVVLSVSLAEVSLISDFCFTLYTSVNSSVCVFGVDDDDDDDLLQ